MCKQNTVKMFELYLIIISFVNTWLVLALDFQISIHSRSKRTDSAALFVSARSAAEILYTFSL